MGIFKITHFFVRVRSNWHSSLWRAETTCRSPFSPSTMQLPVVKLRCQACQHVPSPAELSLWSSTELSYCSGECAHSLGVPLFPGHPHHCSRCPCVRWPWWQGWELCLGSATPCSLTKGECQVSLQQRASVSCSVLLSPLLPEALRLQVCV